MPGGALTRAHRRRRINGDGIRWISGRCPKSRSTRSWARRPRASPKTRPSPASAKYGQNTLPTKVGRPIIFKLLDQFTTLFAIMLEAAALLVFVAAMLSNGSDRQDNINVMIAIIGVVILNGVIGFFQEYRAEKATEALQKLVPANAKVVRDGEVTIVAAADLVPGDIIVLEEGDSISADARVIRQYEMSTNNIALTGESDAVRKTSDAILDEDLAAINMPNMVFMGTTRGGRERAGPSSTTPGSTPSSGASSRSRPASPKRSRRCSATSTAWRAPCRIIALCFGVVLFVLALLVFNFGLVAALLFALGVMVALVPEGLPATLSVALAVGVQRMAKVQALIKKLVRRRDAGLHQRDLHRQDRHAHQGRDDRQGDCTRRTGLRGHRRRLRAGRRLRRSTTRRCPRTRRAAARADAARDDASATTPRCCRRRTTRAGA